MRLRDARPEDLMRCGVVFGQVAEQVQVGIGQARRAASVRWTGRPNQRYQAQLDELCGRMRTVEVSHDAACDVLLIYCRALEPARDLAVQADLLDAEAEGLETARGSVPSAAVWVPATAEEVQLRTRALLLRQEATTREQAASSRCAAELRGLAGDAPVIGGFQSNRFFSDAGGALGNTLIGTATLGRDLIRSVPGVGGDESRKTARDALRAQAKAMAQPWTVIEETLDQLREGRSGLVVGSLGGALVLRRPGGPTKKERLFGSHDRMDPAVLHAIRVRAGLDASDLTQVSGWALARTQRKFLAELRRLQRLPAPTVRQLRDGSLDLMQQEALGGHTLYKHVGRDLEFLRKRQLSEQKPGKAPLCASSFLDEAEAMFLIKRAMGEGDNAKRLADFAASPRPVLRIFGAAEGHGLMVDPSGVAMSPERVVIEFKQKPDGSVFINTAFLEGRRSQGRVGA